MGRIGFFGVFALIGIFAAVAVKVVPVYIEHFHAKAVLMQLSSELARGEKSEEEIIGLLQQRWQLEQVDDIAREDIMIQSQPDGRHQIRIAYDVVVPLVGNLSALIFFDDSTETGQP
ncbi:DUF4845 domain-containing protein [Candidatus Methylospira mobilis]|uniref:DUF4845 domain-containing protein n=1 Tax=Candidatus Methylospira mobilis TaxID=1808979 RepID=A0A5Q0BH80_9GAMM|nr:DUF4845 domain-containing protein [Candidatus Methylospira mobilis]QFY42889.1 DUF4845 domain-containing protein [Candidatus Methylospira mobilis]WNV04052.1 DUF4845 domain-containing protein [Candidatus Methylospira mobilis]